MPSTRKRSKEPAGQIISLFVTVQNKKIPVEVSDGGVFHDKTGKFTATTLKGLEQRMSKVHQVKGAVPVEKDDGSRQGTVVSYDPEYNRYRIKWESGKTGYTYAGNLRRRTSPEERQHMVDLEAASTAAEEANDAAYRAIEDYTASLDISELLKEVFGG